MSSGGMERNQETGTICDVFFLVFVLCCRTLRSEYYLEANANFKKVVK